MILHGFFFFYQTWVYTCIYYTWGVLYYVTDVRCLTWGGWRDAWCCRRYWMTWYFRPKVNCVFFRGKWRMWCLWVEKKSVFDVRERALKAGRRWRWDAVVKARCSSHTGSDGDEARLANVCAVNYGGGGKRGEGGTEREWAKDEGGMKRNVNKGM